MGGKSLARQAREAELDEAQRISGKATEGKYHAGFDRRAHDYALLGATDEQIAEFLEVSPASVSRWMVEHPTFRKAVKKARIDALARVARSAHRLANGFSHRETKVVMVDGKPEKVDITKRYAPSAQAIQYVLGNRFGHAWKDTKSVEHSGRVDLAALISDLHGSQPKPVDPVTIEHQPDDEE